MGSGHFLVEACRFLGEKLYEACRSCDEKALEAERQAETAKTNEKQTVAIEAAQTWRQRIIDLPDTDDELAKTEFVPRESKDEALEPVTGYLPSKSQTPGSLDRTHRGHLPSPGRGTLPLRGRQNPLAVEPVQARSLAGVARGGDAAHFPRPPVDRGRLADRAFWNKLMFRPGKPDTPVEDLFSQGIYGKLQKVLTRGPRLVRRLESSVGSDLADVLTRRRSRPDSIRPSSVPRRLLPGRVGYARNGQMRRLGVRPAPQRRSVRPAVCPT